MFELVLFRPVCVIYRVGQNRIYAPYLTAYLVILLPQKCRIYRTYMYSPTPLEKFCVRARVCVPVHVCLYVCVPVCLRLCMCVCARASVCTLCACALMLLHAYIPVSTLPVAQNAVPMQYQLYNPGGKVCSPAWLPLVLALLCLSLSPVCSCLLQAGRVWGGRRSRRPQEA